MATQPVPAPAPAPTTPAANQSADPTFATTPIPASEVRLPKWASVNQEKRYIDIDPDVAYPVILGALGIAEAQYDQYWLEVAYQCAKMKVQSVVEGSELDPRSRSEDPRPLVINVLSRKDRWALTDFTPGRGIDAATKGREARAYYERISNRI
jgi:hypothetical protein